MAEQETTFRCIVSADLLWRAARCVSHEAARYYLNGVKVEACDAGGAILVSTNGHAAVVIRDADAFVEGSGIVRLSKATLLAMRRPADAKKPPAVVAVDGPRLVVTSRRETDDETLLLCKQPDQTVAAFQWFDSYIEGNAYPDWRRAFPKAVDPTGSPSVRLDPGYVQTMREALCLHGKTGSKGVVIAPAAEGQPRVIFGDGTIDGFGVVMPMRADERFKAELPAWMSAPAQQMAAE